MRSEGLPNLSVDYEILSNVDAPPQWGAADAEIKVSSVENTELEGSPFKAWGRSVHSHTCHANCQGFFPS